MDALVFHIGGEPKPKGRPRTRVQKGRGGHYAQIYTDPVTRKYEAAVRDVAKGAMGGLPPFTGALSVALRFRLKPARSMPQRDRAPVIAGERPYFGRYDADNLGKLILDSLNGVCWGDDKQITRLFITKVASDKPGVDVKITPLEPQDEAL